MAEEQGATGVEIPGCVVEMENCESVHRLSYTYVHVCMCSFRLCEYHEAASIDLL